MNLLKELKETLRQHDLDIKDIKWVGNKNYKVNIDDFLKLADTQYDEGYGVSEVAYDLLIVGDSWWIERGEYDGSEWFRFKKQIDEPTEYKPLSALTIWQKDDDRWGGETLSELNNWE